MIGNDRDYRGYLNVLKGQKNQLVKVINKGQAELDEAIQDKDDAEMAQLIIQDVARITQKQLEYHISELVSLALASVFSDPYEFEVEFITARKQTEVKLWFVKDGERIHPLSASGGGVVDIASFALRVSLLALKTPPSRKVLIIDEPFKNLSAKYIQKASDMVKMLSDKIGIQVIMVTHITELIDSADAVYSVSLHNGVSNARRL